MAQLKLYFFNTLLGYRTLRADERRGTADIWQDV